MKKLLSIISCIAILLSFGTVPAFALKINTPFYVDGNSVYTLAEAFAGADNGSVITQNGNTGNLYETAAGGIEVTKNVTLMAGKDFSSRPNSISYVQKTNNVSSMPDEPLFIIKDGGVLTIRHSVLYGNSGAANPYGGLIRVEKGGTLILSGTANEPVVISGCELTAQNARGGAIYAEQGGKVILNGVTFAGNSAAQGADVYAEQKTDVTVAEGVTADIAYGESVDINGLNLILTGEIGLTFHTVVPDRYLDGKFVLTSRTGEEVTLDIADCYQDAKGRYMAKYHVSALELSEPVTLTVCDKNGAPIVAKEKSVEDYGNWLLESEDTSDADKNAIRALLNYGHYAQIECAGYEGWEIGTDYAETVKYADLTTPDSAFGQYTTTWEGHDPVMSKIGVQLAFGYKSDVILHFPTAAKPTVLVNGEAAEVTASALSGYRWCVTVKGIGALDLAQTYAVRINDNVTLTLSALSYCQMAIAQKGDDCKNAVKALYEFYLATLACNR